MREYLKKFFSKEKEFSKRLTSSIRTFMFFHVLLVIAGDIVLTLNEYDPSLLNNTLVVMMPVYIALQSGYFIKAEKENVKKIGSAAKTEENG